MERRSVYLTLVFIVLFLPKTHGTHRIFSCGESVNGNLKTCLSTVYLINRLTRPKQISLWKVHVPLQLSDTQSRREVLQIEILRCIIF